MTNSQLIERQARLFGRYQTEGVQGLRHTTEIYAIGQELNRRMRWSALYAKLGERYPQR